MTSKPIVVGVDASPVSLRAAALAWKIAEAAKAKCYFVHAVSEQRLSPTIGSAPAYAAYVRSLVWRALTAARQEITTRLRRVVPPAAARSLDVRPGRAARVLADAVARSGAGLVVLGGKHHGVLARVLSGDTAHYLVRTLDVPVLVTGGGSTRVERVLVAADLSYAARPTLETAAALAKVLGARLRALHVVEPIRYSRVVPRAPDRKAFRRESVETFKRLASIIPAAVESEIVIREGVAANAIAAEARRWKADVLVVGSHGKGLVDRLLVGSTTEWLLNSLAASLLIVPVARVRGSARQRRSRQLTRTHRPASAG